ncbi:hypothetical protein D3C86_1177130 [compost metagenome]
MGVGADAGADHHQLAAGRNVEATIKGAERADQIRRTGGNQLPLAAPRQSAHRVVAAVQPPQPSIGRVGRRALEHRMELGVGNHPRAVFGQSAMQHHLAQPRHVARRRHQGGVIADRSQGRRTLTPRRVLHADRPRQPHLGDRLQRLPGRRRQDTLGHRVDRGVVKEDRSRRGRIAERLVQAGAHRQQVDDADARFLLRRRLGPALAQIDRSRKIGIDQSLVDRDRKQDGDEALLLRGHVLEQRPLARPTMHEVGEDAISLRRWPGLVDQHPAVFDDDEARAVMLTQIVQQRLHVRRRRHRRDR